MIFIFYNERKVNKMKLFNIFYNSTSETHKMALRCYLKAFRIFVDMFNRTKPGVNYYVKWTEEETIETHKEMAEKTLDILNKQIKKDEVAYSIVTVLFEKELKEMQEVLAVEHFNTELVKELLK